MAGQVLPGDGIVKFAPNLAWHNVDLKAAIRNELNIPVVVLNDVRAGTWGEWKFGGGKGVEDIVCLMIGTGIGGGAVIGGKLMSGVNNSAGELGHFTVELKGPKCTCGNIGCLESLAAGWAIAKQGNAKSAKEVLRSAEQGDKPAKLIIENAIEAIVAGCVGYANVFNPSRLILGGGLGLALPNLLERVEQGVKERALTTASEKLQVVPATLMNRAPVIGAASYALFKCLFEKKQGAYDAR